MFKRVSRAVFLAALSVCAASASLITYDFSMLGAGTLNGQSFTSTTVLLEFQSDTTSIINLGGGIFVTPNGIPGTFNITGTASGAITSSLHLFNNQGAQVAGINPGPDFLDMANSSFATYNLATAFGPVTATGPGFQGSLATDHGALAMTSISQVTFTATTGQVPEPATFFLLGAGLVAVAFLRRRV